ncbi:MAG: 2-dehydropantoate 2-reductase [Leptothrix sp. (in: Bacteria)]|nr:2-dehydropantoate 2-reductase [Leptothrix sp. (in: b-proteobacteria)]
MPTLPAPASAASPAPTPAPVPGGAIAIVGAGAVGSWMGALLALAGHTVRLIGREPHMQAVRRQGLLLQRTQGSVTAFPEAGTELAAVQGAGLVLVCVKSGDTDSVARALAPLLDERALVLSLQNGVGNVATLQAHLRQAVLPVVVYAATALPAPGVVQHLGGGDLVIGPAGAMTHGTPQAALQHSRLQAVAALFTAAGLQVRVSSDAMHELWAKLVVNCACNAVSALAQASYGEMAAVPAVHGLQRAAVQEAVAVAAAEGQALSLPALLAAVDRIAATMPAQRSSTAQDLARGRPTEIEQLNGHVVRRGAVHGVATPVNQALLALVQLAEAATQR